MHESSLAKQVLDAVLAKASGEGAIRVTLVRGWLAETETLSKESIDFHFLALARGTAAEGARLELDRRRVDARCVACANIYTPEHHMTLCPVCDGTEAELLGPTGLCIESIDVEP
jgi:hydrogenase nickel incorporation protein HypA/HybF